MKAIVKKYAKEGVWMDDVPVPTYGDDEVLIKIHKTSICGTDVHIYKWDSWAQRNVPVPLTIGHEFVGEIAAMGSKVQGMKVGDRVSGEGHLVCNQCPPCLRGEKQLCMNTRGVGYHATGCFAEYFALPSENVFLLPKGIKDDWAAIMDPFGNAVHTALSAELVGEDVLITGAGPIGIMACAIAKHAGARHIVITDLNDYRLGIAKQMGATRTVNITKENLQDVMKSIGVTHGFTVGMEMSGHPNGLKTLIDSAQHGAKIALLGILPPGTAIDWDPVIFRMLTIKGIYGREIFRTWIKMTHMLESGLNLDPVITHNFKADEFQKGFDAMLSGMAGKVILDWR